MKPAEKKAFNEWIKVEYSIYSLTREEKNLIMVGVDWAFNYKKKSSPELKAKPVNIITFLNERTGKKSGKGFPLSETNLKVVIARLKEGFTEDEIRQVIVLKSRDDFFRKNKLLRPSTLFGKTKFSNYVGELGG